MVRTHCFKGWSVLPCCFFGQRWDGFWRQASVYSQAIGFRPAIIRGATTTIKQKTYIFSRTRTSIRDVPCRAQIWWIRAVPNISVPCPHDPVPCQIFPCRALMIRAQIWWIRAVRLRRASRNMGPFFCGKKSACGNAPTS